jgi:hypothetical protein
VACGCESQPDIKRPGIDGLMDFKGLNVNDRLKSVKYYGRSSPALVMSASTICRNDFEELQAAITDEEQHGAKSLIFDLRSNGGGCGSGDHGCESFCRKIIGFTWSKYRRPRNTI